MKHDLVVQFFRACDKSCFAKDMLQEIGGKMHKFHLQYLLLCA